MKRSFLQKLLVVYVNKAIVTIGFLWFACGAHFAHAQENSTATAVEQKVDYLEQIYFSGENKKGLSTQILIALQEMQGRQATAALAKQVTFLLDVQDEVENSENACDVLDLIAVGIYNIEAAEATRQGVTMPTNTAKLKTSVALPSLEKLNSTSGELSSSAGNAAWSGYRLTGGKYGSFASGAGKVARTSASVGNITGAAAQAGRTATQLADLVNRSVLAPRRKISLAGDVVKKDIQIGDYVAENAATVASVNKEPATTAKEMLTTVITISKVSSASLRALTDSLKNKPEIQSAEKAFAETVSTITVSHAGSTDVLADWLADKFGNTFKVVTYSSGKISLALKNKKVFFEQQNLYRRLI